MFSFSSERYKINKKYFSNISLNKNISLSKNCNNILYIFVIKIKRYNIYF